MAVFAIYDGRTSFWQWDLDQRLIVSDDVCCEVHFCNGTTECALVCEVYEQDGQRLANVPNVLLQTGKPLRVFAYGDDRTIHSEIFTVIARTKPDDYVYTETEVWTAEKAVETALQKAKDSGEFKGDPGEPGKDGDDNVFICHYGETTYDELVTAHEAGKTMVLKDGTFEMLFLRMEGVHFVFSTNTTTVYYNRWCHPSSGWSGRDLPIPNDARVKALENQVGDIETALDSILAIQNELIGGGNV